MCNTTSKAVGSPIPSSSANAGASSGDALSRYGMSPASFRNEIRRLKRNHYVLTQEMTEIVDPVARQRQAREIATLEIRLAERGFEI